MSIISLPLTNQLTNGGIADGGQVLADLNAIASQVNANAAANGVNSDITQLTALAAVPASVTATGWTLNGVTINSGSISGTAIASTNAALTTPTITGGTLTGVTVDSTSTGVTQAPGTNNTSFATCAYVINQAFASSLPGISAGVTDYFVTNNGTTASWGKLLKDSTIRFANAADATKLLAFDCSGITTGTTRTLTAPNANGTIALAANIGLTPLATLTPTSAVNLDALSVFSSTYDNYRIVIDGVKPAADDNLLMRVGVSGSADSGANYAGATSWPITFSLHSGSSYATTAAGKGVSVVIDITNANDATNGKVAMWTGTTQSAATPTYSPFVSSNIYTAVNAISGFRLFWSSGSNFAVTGKVHIYGYN